MTGRDGAAAPAAATTEITAAEDGAEDRTEDGADDGIAAPDDLLTFQLKDVSHAFAVSEDAYLWGHSHPAAAAPRLDLVGGTEPMARMVAAQAVAIHDVTMASLARVAEMRLNPREQGNYVMDAVRLARASIRQMEALARLKARPQDAGTAITVSLSAAGASADGGPRALVPPEP